MFGVFFALGEICKIHVKKKINSSPHMILMFSIILSSMCTNTVCVLFLGQPAEVSRSGERFNHWRKQPGQFIQHCQRTGVWIATMRAQYLTTPPSATKKSYRENVQANYANSHHNLCLTKSAFRQCNFCDFVLKIC